MFKGFLTSILFDIHGFVLPLVVSIVPVGVMLCFGQHLPYQYVIDTLCSDNLCLPCGHLSMVRILKFVTRVY